VLSSGALFQQNETFGAEGLVLSFYKAAGVLVLVAVLTATGARAEDLDCTKYVPQIGKTIRVPCNDAPAKPPPSLEPQATPAQPTKQTPESREADASPCLTEENPGTAMRICQEFLNNNAGLPTETRVAAYNRLALGSLRVKDYQGVLSWAKKSLEFAPSAVEHYMAGQAYAELKNPKAAIEEFSAAIELAPKYTVAFHRRGEAYLEIDDVDNAKSDFQAALAIYSKFTPSLEALKRLRRRG
jgi:tetratricopeptide (TPR) repeat protein